MAKPYPITAVKYDTSDKLFFDSAKQAAEHFKTSRNYIYECVKHQSEGRGGWYFRRGGRNLDKLMSQIKGWR